MKAQTFREMTAEELNLKLNELKQELFNQSYADGKLQARYRKN